MILIRRKINLNSLSQRLIGLWPFLFLIGQNLIIFRNHYFHDFGFPWDFPQGYYAMVVFWTTLVSQGTFPSWVPYHSLGMPIDLVLQSAVHYPPLWIFPILRIEYSLHVAVVFQCLHILSGGIGLFLFLGLVFKNSQYVKILSLLGAFLFQMFGGFYSNSEHVDIVRAFALAPWLFYLFQIPNTKVLKPTWRCLIIPLFIFMMITGSYPGNIISGLLILGIYFSFQVIDLYMKKVNPRNLFSYSGIVFLMVLLGLGLSVVHLGPSWLFRNQLFRTEQLGSLDLMYLGIEHLPGLFLDNALIPGEISMTSTYLTLPALILVSFIPLHLLKEHWPISGILVFSIFMSAGPSSFLWFFLNYFFKPLQYSRFPTSDYRIYIAITLIYLTLFAIKVIVDNHISWRGFFIRTGFIILWFLQGLYMSQDNFRSTAVYNLFAICCITILTVAAYIYKKDQRMAVGFLFFIMVLFAVDAARVLPKMRTWQLPSISTFYKNNGWSLEVNDRLVTSNILENNPIQRPARIAKDTYMDYSWEGFITGQYTLLNFLSSSMLKSAASVLDESTYKNYMLKEWTPLIFEEFPSPDKTKNITIPPELISYSLLASSDHIDSIQQINYGVNEIRYNVLLNKPALMVENEMYFPGWKAQLISSQTDMEIDAISVNKIFRGWVLPSGNYVLKAFFIFPYDQIFKTISYTSLLLWMIVTYFIKMYMM